MTKVYNKGTRPIPFSRKHTGTEVIHPGKFDLFGDDKAKEIIKKFDDAVSEADWKKLQDEKKKKSEADRKKVIEDRKAREAKKGE